MLDRRADGIRIHIHIVSRSSQSSRFVNAVNTATCRPAIMISYLISGLVATLTALCYAE